MPYNTKYLMQWICPTYCLHKLGHWSMYNHYTRCTELQKLKTGRKGSAKRWVLRRNSERWRRGDVAWRVTEAACYRPAQTQAAVLAIFKYDW